MAKGCNPAVPGPILVLMKWISTLNLAAQPVGPKKRELRLNQLWLIVGRGCCWAVGSSLIWLKMTNNSLCSLHPHPGLAVLFMCVQACAWVQLTDAVNVSRLTCRTSSVFFFLSSPIAWIHWPPTNVKQTHIWKTVIYAYCDYFSVLWSRRDEAMSFSSVWLSYSICVVPYLLNVYLGSLDCH